MTHSSEITLFGRFVGERERERRGKEAVRWEDIQWTSGGNRMGKKQKFEVSEARGLVGKGRGRITGAR